MSNESYWITNADGSRAHDLCVEGELVVKAPHDIPKDARIDLQRIGIDCRHVTALSQRIEPHDRVADVQLGARPVALPQPVDAAYEDIGAQPPGITAERGNGAVRRDEERKDVETIEAIPRLEPRVESRRALDERKRFEAVPRVIVDQRPIVGAKRPMETKKSELAPRGAHSFGSPHADDTVAGDAVRPDIGGRQRFTAERFDRVAPETCHVKRHLCEMREASMV